MHAITLVNDLCIQNELAQILKRILRKNGEDSSVTPDKVSAIMVIVYARNSLIKLCTLLYPHMTMNARIPIIMFTVGINRTAAMQFLPRLLTVKQHHQQMQILKLQLNPYPPVLP